ncbi:hypothetical protein V8Q34_22505 [Blautia sp. JLR.GB0024]|uniref:hypothetical protein n=1 Tax=Blautia sp. JLR.GB0024 TaxID=3123295 RepID=UPI00051C2898
MDRLTIPDEKIDGGWRRTVVDARAVKENAMTLYWQLKKYEDTGLAPERIRAIDQAYANQAKELMGYKRDEEQGLLLRLPCKMDENTKVYEIYRFCGEGAWEIEEHYIKFSDLKKIGMTVFLTREAAEKALAEMED